jgi:hypothetical protein
MFVRAYDAIEVNIPYDGPERASFEAIRRSMFEDM